MCLPYNIFAHGLEAFVQRPSRYGAFLRRCQHPAARDAALLTSMSKTLRVPMRLNPMFSHSGRWSGSTGAVVSGAFRAPLRGRSKWGVSFVR